MTDVEEPETTESQSPPGRAHRRLALGLIFVASLLAFLAIFAIWANRQLLNTDNWTETSSELLENDAIRTQVGKFPGRRALHQRRRERRAPDSPGTGPSAGRGQHAGRAGRQRPEDAGQPGGEHLLGRPVPQQLWEEANRRAHLRLLQVIEGGGDTLSTSNGEVTLDLSSLLSQTQSNLGVGGRVAERLPEGAAQIVLFRSDQLGIGTGRRPAVEGPRDRLGAPGSGAPGPRRLSRPRMATGGAAGVRDRLVSSPAPPLWSLGRWREARWWTLSRPPSPCGPQPRPRGAPAPRCSVQAATATVIYGVVVAFAAWLAGPTAWAVGARRGLAPYLREPRFAWGAFGVIVLVLVAWAPTPAFRSVVTGPDPDRPARPGRRRRCAGRPRANTRTRAARIP